MRRNQTPDGNPASNRRRAPAHVGGVGSALGRTMVWLLGLIIGVVGACVVTGCGAQPGEPLGSATAGPDGQTSSTDSSIPVGWEPVLSPGGQVILIKDETPDTLDLAFWALGRFREAGIDEPRVSSIDFNPGPTECVGLSGWTLGNGKTDVFICIPEERLCRHVNGTEPTTVGKFCLLHELSHAWIIDHVDEAGRRALIEYTGTEFWASAEVPWHERGVEHAAEFLAWGLMDRALELHRLDNPGCEHVLEGFQMLTGTSPLTGCNTD